MVALFDPQPAARRPELRLVTSGSHAGGSGAQAVVPGYRGPVAAATDLCGQGLSGNAPGGGPLALAWSSAGGLRAVFGHNTHFVLAASALVVLVPLVMLRAAQGAPPASDWSGVAAATPAVDAAAIVEANESGAIDDVGLIVVARAGDSLWSIAERLMPGEDPRPLVAALREANGGDSVAQGQQIVIPEHLLD